MEMNNHNNEQEREANMGFTLAKGVEDTITEMVSLRDWDQEEARIIPGTDGMVLVKKDSSAYLDRKNNSGIFMIPVKVKMKTGGTGAEPTFFVCTK